MAIERGKHEVACEPIRQRNAERRQASAQRQEQRKLVEAANADLVRAAEQLHQQRLYEVCLLLLVLMLLPLLLLSLAAVLQGLISAIGEQWRSSASCA